MGSTSCDGGCSSQRFRELGCGGTLALLAEQIRQVGIVHLTRGERGTRGGKPKPAPIGFKAGFFGPMVGSTLAQPTVV